MTDLPILCLVRDLLFYSKIRAAAQTANVTIRSLREPAQLAESIGTGLLVDLNQPNASEAAAQWRQRTGCRVVGFASHVDTQTIRSARLAGIDQVFTRNQFELNLPSVITSFGNSV